MDVNVLTREDWAAALDLSNAFIRTFEGEILSWSSGCQKTYGWLASDAVGRCSHELLRTRFPEPVQSINALLEANGSWCGSLVHLTRNGDRLNVFSHWLMGKANGYSSPHIVEINLVSAGSEPLLASLVASTNDAVIGATLTGIVTSWNAAAQRLFEYTAEEMIGQHISVLFPNTRHEDEDRLIAKIQAGDTVSNYETTRVTKSGRFLTISLTVSPIYNFAQELVGISKIARDITEMRRDEDALRQANASLEEFAYAAAHDLQEPLRNISLSLQQLALANAHTPDAEQTELMQIAIGNANRMQNLIKDLLSFSRAVNPGNVNLVDCDSDAVVAQAAENLSQALKENNARLLVQGPLPRVSMHSSHMLQLMQNLIGNSLKYRRPAIDPVIAISARHEPSQVIFSVSDNGIGISPMHYKRIFGVFKRLDHRMPGNGIGLAVCKRIVEHYAGTIWVESKEGHGSTFSFSVPHLREQVTPL